MEDNNYLNPSIDRSSLKIGGGNDGIHNHKLKIGDNVFRILPPFGPKAAGRLMAEWYLHWGFKDANGRPKPLVCTKKYEGYCPICAEANELYNRKQEIVKEYMDDKGKIQFSQLPPDVKTEYNRINDNWKDIRSQRSYYYNAMDTSGRIGVLRLPKLGAQALNDKIEFAIDRLNINPVSLEKGCLFIVRKVKTGSMDWDIKYEADIFKEIEKDENGQTIERTATSAVPANVIENYTNLAIDVHELYTIRPSTDIKKIMIGDHSVFKAEEDAKKKAQEERAANGTNPPTGISKSAEAPASTPTPATTPPAEAPVEAPASTTPPSTTDSETERTDLQKLKDKLKVTK